ncbi:unnamed protein product [Rotaria magnacalcarata]|uniref:Pentatricopeptide repeat-containing protein n=3 Tax=Rotaria magnacalcarata TaxID=392030 RepID=A0A816WJS4_9BILA|nr:unnamed protein product [Rotaria magnacalcarata]CAF1365008.1 unnamed protein product [Rotaria magnacalcarata]CAF2135478.1 unnamed protein product [Rotaria magnacalcarata]CAF2135479.1 unnamed protein product [Rotaria magnacalcarata]
MADILRRVAVLAINRASWGNLHVQIRTVFSSSGIGIDNFKSSRDQHVARFAPSLDAFKKRFVDSIEQSNSQIFTEDLRNMIMSAENDTEIETVIQALKKYSNNKVKFSDYHFGSPIMRLLYIQNKTNLALELYMNETLKNVFNDSASALVLMNKLIEEKRYDDAVKVFDFGSQRGFSTASGRVFPSDVVMLAIEGLYRKNTKDALTKAKEIMSKVKEHDSDVNPRTAAMVALLAIQQGETSFAMEILDAVHTQNYTIVKNIRAICYADMGRIEESINVIQLLAEQAPINNDRRRVFPLVMRHIRIAAEKLNDQSLLSRFEELSKTVLKNNRLSTTDIPEFLSEPINRRGPIRNGPQSNMRGDFRQNQGDFRNQGGYNNQQSANFRQGYSGGFNRQPGGFNRENRFGNNFQRQDFGYERRSQNYNADGYQRNENDRFPSRNRSSSFNDYSRQDGRNQQQYQSFSRVNRTDNESGAARRYGNPVQSESKRNSDDASKQEQSSWERSSRNKL